MLFIRLLPRDALLNSTNAAVTIRNEISFVANELFILAIEQEIEHKNSH